MNTNVVRKRINQVIKTDSVSSSQGDFLATHVPLNRLHLLDSFQIEPTSSVEYTEEAVYEDYVLNPDNRHQLITVYGQSGTGKSHLIRWFEARFEQDKPTDEVVLFIKRSDNTLKGTIKQLLDKEEVRNIHRRDIYERLVEASISVEENKLKDLLYTNFGIEVRNDNGSHGITITNTESKRLSAFLDNEVIRNYMLRENGPVERMYSKIAEHTDVDRDTVAQFLPSDFSISNDLMESLESSGGDVKAARMARKLMADDSGDKEAEKIANYLNQFVNDVIQRCAGIEPGDFKQVFLEIRKELYKQGKGLTLFVEDITSFTGVDDALLDALIVENTGLNEEEHLCRISSIIGTTSGYLQTNFRDNHKDRITKFVYIPDNVFPTEELFEFVGRYINTMSLETSEVEDWLSKHANPADYPIHNNEEGEHWDTVTIAHGKSLNLYPFSKRSIEYLYNLWLPVGQKTPRFIIRKIIEPVLRDVLDHKDHFPDEKYKVTSNANSSLNFSIHNQIDDDKQANRLFRFLSIWGNGKPEEYTDESGTRYICSIREDLLQDFSFPLITLSDIEPPASETKTNGTLPDAHEEPQPEEPIISVSEDRQVKIANLEEYLGKWVNEKTIDISTSLKNSAAARNAVEDLTDYLKTAINWQGEGESYDNAKKAFIDNGKLFFLEGQTKNRDANYPCVLPATWESQFVLMAFARWHEFGQCSWNYRDADFDAFIVSEWTEKHKREILTSVSEDSTTNGLEYIDAALAYEILGKLFCGNPCVDSVDDISIELVCEELSDNDNSNHHTSDWNALARIIKRNAESNHKTILDYYNLIQGTSGGSLKVFDYLSFDRALHNVKNKLVSLVLEPAIENEVIKARRDIYFSLQEVYNRLDTVLDNEQEALRSVYSIVTEALDEDVEEDDITDLTSAAERFYNKVNEVQFNIGIADCSYVKQNANHIANAIKNIKTILDSDSKVEMLVLMSKDPCLTVNPLVELLQKLDQDLIKANQNIEFKKAELGDVDDQPSDIFMNAMDELAQDIARLEKEV